MKRLLYGVLCFPFFMRGDEIEKVIQAAYLRSWEVQNATYIRENAVDEYKNKSRFFLPSVTMNAYNGFQRPETAENGDDNLSEYTIEAKSTLFSMTQIDDVKIARAGREVQDLKYQEKKNKFCLDVANLYLNYLLEKRKNANTAQILDILNRQFDITSSEYRQGLKPRKDYLRLRSELRGTELEQLSQSVSLKSAEDKLRDKIGPDFGRFVYNPTSLEVPEISFAEEDSAKDSALEKSLTKELDVLRHTRDKSRHELWPKLSLGANYKWGDKSFWDDDEYNPRSNDYWSVTLNLSYTFWDWGIERRSKEITIRGTRVRENEVFQEMRNAQNDVDLVRQRIKVARRVYSARTSLLGDERESFGLISRDYREGRINFLDYVSSLRSFGRAELSLFEGLVELNKAYFEILLHKGDLDAYFKVR